MQNEVKVGDVVAWEDVPSNALVREDDAACAGCFTVRRADRGLMVWAPGAQSWRSIVANDLDDDGWPWERGNSTTATIIALNLTGQETAADLQRLAEVYEVREAVATDLALLKAVVEVKTRRHLWTPDDAIEFVPAVLPQVFGDGKALLALTTINSRPRFYVIRIDNSWRDIHDHIDDICGALGEHFGEIHRDDEDFDADDPVSEWPTFDDENGTSWGWITDDLAERLHAAGWRPGMTVGDAARLLAEAGR